jgi:ubiquinone/menaquinone biosynthesis C-methylase UbiE
MNSAIPTDYYQRGVRSNFLQRFWHFNKLKIILGLMGNKNPLTVLEIGCASGWLLSRISKRFSAAKCVGIDIDTSLVAYGSKLYPNLKLSVGDAHRLPFPPRAFDIIVCAEVLEHLENPSQVLKEMNRVLKPNGHLVLEIDTNNLLFRTAWFVWTRFKGRIWKGAHLHSFKDQELKKLFHKSGFIVMEKRMFNLSMAVAYLLKKN